MPTPMTPSVLGEYGMCLLHADYHPMGADCWASYLDWNLAHHRVPRAERTDRYMDAVERAMLDAHLANLNPTVILAV